MKLYKIRAYSAATVVMFCLGAALFGAMILLPLYFQVARGQDAIHTGLLLIPQGIGAAIGMRRSAAAIEPCFREMASISAGIRPTQEIREQLVVTKPGAMSVE